MKDKTDLKIALAILIPGIVVGAIIGQVTIVQQAHGQENDKCDESDLERNGQDNFAGNPHCVGDFRFEDGNSAEPTRDCSAGSDNAAEQGPEGRHNNALKDHDGDGSACVGRGEGGGD